MTTMTQHTHREKPLTSVKTGRLGYFRTSCLRKVDERVERVRENCELNIRKCPIVKSGYNEVTVLQV